MIYRAVLASMYTMRRHIRILKRHLSLREIWEITHNNLLEAGFSDEKAGAFIQARNACDPESELRKVQKCGARILTPEDKEYPFLLKQMRTPPLFLYIRGKLPSEDLLHLAVVGSRNMTQYTERVLEAFVPELVQQRAVIVSGLAYGVDAKAHEIAVSYGGRAIAVLGSGIDTVYPVVHTHLAEKILEHDGAILSDYPPGMVPSKITFPARNRIIAGLSHGTFVAQAGEKSGALITASMALDEGREVFSLPGDVLSPEYKGTNRLIAEGAHVIIDAKTIFHSFGVRFFSTKSRENFEDTLTEMERGVMQYVTKEPRSISEVQEKFSIPLQKISSILTSLEMRGFIRIDGDIIAIRA